MFKHPFFFTVLSTLILVIRADAKTMCQLCADLVLSRALCIAHDSFHTDPTLWVLFEAGVIDPVTSHLMHVLFDVIAKSVRKIV